MLLVYFRLTDNNYLQRNEGAFVKKGGSRR